MVSNSTLPLFVEGVLERGREFMDYKLVYKFQNKYCLLADYNQFYIQILLLWREVAEDGAGNGFRDFVHV
jgi:hypothetical protein